MPVQVQGPDGKTYQFPEGTDKAAAVSYFRKKGIGASQPPSIPGAAVMTAGHGTPNKTPDPWAGHRIDEAAAKTEKFLEKNAAPIFGTVGGLAGGLPGAIIGGALAGSADSPKEALKQGAEQGFIEAGGVILTPVARVLGKVLGRGADEAMAKILGLRFAKNPKFGRSTAEAIGAIGNIVNKYVGGAATLPSLANKIGVTKEAFNQATEQIIQKTPGAKLVPWDSIVYNDGVKAIDMAEAYGRSTKAIDELVDTLQKKAPPNATPKEMLDIRRTLLKETDASGQTLWPAGTKQFRRQLYTSLNDAIKQSLPPKEAADFATNNNAVHKLILAEDAIDERLAKRATGQEARKSAGEVIAGVAKSSVLPAAGAAEGYRRDGVGGAIAGAALGYGASRALESTATKTMGVAARKALAKAAPRVAAAAKYAPAAARAIQVISNIQSRPQNGP